MDVEANPDGRRSLRDVARRLRDRAFGLGRGLPPRRVDVGWLLQGETPELIWAPPGRVQREKPTQRHAKSFLQCPAVVEFESRLVQITCPFDIELGIQLKDGEAPQLIDL